MSYNVFLCRCQHVLFSQTCYRYGFAQKKVAKLQNIVSNKILMNLMVTINRLLKFSFLLCGTYTLSTSGYLVTSSSLRPGGRSSRTLAVWPLDSCTENVLGVGNAIVDNRSCWQASNIRLNLQNTYSSYTIVSWIGYSYCATAQFNNLYNRTKLTTLTRTPCLLRRQCYTMTK
jgi:hypothetical protein